MGTYRVLGSWLSSLKLARMAALSFWMTARSSAIVLAARTLRINCFTAAPEVSAAIPWSKSGRGRRGHTRTHLGEQDDPAIGPPCESCPGAATASCRDSEIAKSSISSRRNQGARRGSRWAGGLAVFEECSPYSRQLYNAGCASTGHSLTVCAVVLRRRRTHFNVGHWPRKPSQPLGTYLPDWPS